MPTPLRARLEAVVRKYVLSTGCDCDGRRQKDRSLLNDLVACSPTPSREGLCQLFSDYYVNVDGQLASMHEQFTDKVMAWASGQSATSNWCEHCWKDKAHGTWLRRIRPQAGSVRVFDSERFCAICAAPRPVEEE